MTSLPAGLPRLQDRLRSIYMGTRLSQVMTHASTTASAKVMQQSACASTCFADEQNSCGAGLYKIAKCSLACVCVLPELSSRDKPWPCSPSCFLSAAAPKVPPCPVRQEAHASRQVRLDTPLLTARGSGRNDKMVRYAGACTWRCVCVRACRLRVPEFARACACMHACLRVCRSDGLRVCAYLLVNSV